MSQSTTEIRTVPPAPTQDVLTDLLRDGARRLPARAIEAEVAGRIDDHAHLSDDQGRRQVVRDGHLPERPIYVNYPGRDNDNFDAEARSFAWLVARRGVDVQLSQIPGGRHNLPYIEEAELPAYRWLGRQIAPPATR